MPELAYLNAETMPISEAMVPIEDRGYQFGDAVYEYMASYDGELFAVEEHFKRLERSLKTLSFPAINLENLRSEMLAFYKKADLPRAGLYLQISRGVSPRDHAFPEAPVPQIVMTVKRLAAYHPLKDHGVGVITIPDIRWQQCDIKTVQLLPNVLGKQKAVASEEYDAVFISRKKVVREATSSNLIIVKNGVVVTHPLTTRILPGVTRQKVLGSCFELGIPVEERYFYVDELMAADEVMLTGTVTEVLPVIRVDGKPIGDASPGPMAVRLFKELRRQVVKQ